MSELNRASPSRVPGPCASRPPAAPTAPRVRTSSADTRLGRRMFARVDHIGVAVDDLDAALALYGDALEMPVAHREVVEQQGVEAVLLDVGENHVELLRPLSDDTPVGRFLARRGPGLHHVAYQVTDISMTLGKLRELGVRMIDTVPRTGIRGSKVAFVHPSASGSVLTELVEPATLSA